VHVNDVVDQSPSTAAGAVDVMTRGAKEL